MFSTDPGERVRTYDVQHITIEVKLDLVNKTVDGRTITTIIPLNNSFINFEVDAVGMDIIGVSRIQNVDQSIKNFFGEPKPKVLTYKYDKTKLTVNLDREYSTFDTIMYVVEYTTTDPEKGLYFISPTSTFPDKPYQVWTQGEGEDNRYWFPCYDYPNDFATTEIFVTVDKKYQTLSNGINKSITENPDGTATWHWAQDLPHVSYLVMLAVGNWDVIEESWDDIPVSSYVPLGKKEWGQRSYRNTTDILKFFSEDIGFRYPWGKFSQVAVEDFIYGGMENTGAVVLFKGSCYDEKTEPDYTARNLVAHELAHQWWGDVVTCSNWSEMWLNESFATYYQCLYTEYHLGKDEFDYNIYRNGNNAIKADSTTARKPIYMTNGLSVNTYDKGSVVLNMLRYQLGDERFKKAMNLYIEENKYQPVVTSDLVKAVNEATYNPMIDYNKEWSWFFDEWIYSAGQPEYEVSYNYDIASKRLQIISEQVQRMDSTSVFQIPVPVEIITAGTTESVFAIPGPPGDPSSVYVELDSKPISVNFNKGNKVLCKLYFSKPKSDWLYQLKNSPDAIDRITALKGLKDFINDDDVVYEITKIMKTDNFWGVRFEAADMLSFSNNKKVADTYLKDLTEEKDSRVRRSYILGIGNLYNANPELKENKSVLEFFLLNLMDSEPGYYAPADCITTLEKIMDKGDMYETCIKMLQRDSHVEIIRRSAIAAIDSTNDPRSVDILMKWAETGSLDRLRRPAVYALGSFLSEQKVVDFLNGILINNTRGTQGVILSLLNSAKNRSSLPYLQKLHDISNDVKFKSKVQIVINTLK
jgi:aminopeptidase N